MSAFLDSLDIANRACDHCGVSHIRTPSEVSKNNSIISAIYDKAREAELRRNVWRFAVKRTMIRAVDVNTMILDPQLWNAATIYQPGAVVKDADDTLWYSTLAENVNNPPATTAVWDQYFGPMTADPYDATEGYFPGELVYMPVTGKPGGYVVYMALTANNGVAPNVATAWDATVVYNAGQSVSYGGSQWWSLIEYNVGVTPADAPLAFDPGAIYASAQAVTASDGYIYTSLSNGNTGNDPVTSPGFWTNTNVPAAWDRAPAIYPSALTWLPLFASLRRLTIFYPLGSGPASQAASRNIFRLPAGYLRKAPKDPKAGSVSFLGAPSGTTYDDWVYEDDYIVTRNAYPIPLRFVADVKDVRKMDAMFCEGLGCRIGMEACEPLTQSTSKLQAIGSLYKGFMGEARLANAVEVGAEEPPEDDYITCRQ